MKLWTNEYFVLSLRLKIDEKMNIINTQLFFIYKLNILSILYFCKFNNKLKKISLLFFS